ncbi:lipid II flippase MurJ [Phycicoccus sp. SLBN-51]|uniref:murein biosynthesis integral membrane protein MurJ n=1 Tax=Phycicoccus sp. SLBN-51 TaxID=2768447 RepID=UPI001151B55C|nr:lipid II flippase MurJ [Phycicoccus sp. SLBN-51]TQJ51091.1 putative peptidoglycan lipid II flippase [Phycicoccus sp. SLBN-51]
MSAEPARPARSAPRGVTTSIARAAGIIAVATLLARIAGFARTLVFSDSVGTTGVGSIYQTVNTIPNAIFEVAAGGVLAAAAVPLVAGQLGAGREEDADRTSSALLTWAVAVLLPLAALLALAAPALSEFMLGAKYSQESVDLATRMLVIFAPQVVLYGIGIVLTGVLQARRSFLAPALAPLLSSLVVIAAYVAYGQLSEAGSSADAVSDEAVWVLAGGTTLGVAVLSLPLFVPAWRAGARLRPTFRFPEGSLRRVATLASAGVLALVAQQLAVVATMWLTNHRAGQGAVNVYAYVQAVYLLPYAVLAVPIATSAFPALAHGEGAGTREQGTLARSLQAILLLCGGAAAVLVAVARPVGTFFQAFDRGADAGGGPALAAIPETLVAYAPGLVGFGAAALLTRALYVRGRPSLAALAVAAGWLVAALWPLLTLPEDAGAAGTLRSLGAASSVGMTLSALLLGLLVRRAWGDEATRGASRTLGAIVVAAAVAAGIGDLVAFYWDPHGMLGAVVAGVTVAAVTAVLYLGVMAVADRRAIQAGVARGRRRRGRAA